MTVSDERAAIIRWLFEEDAKWAAQIEAEKRARAALNRKDQPA